MNNDLMMAVLSMAAYIDPKTPPNIGFATKLNIDLPAGSDNSGFSAVAYNYDGKTVIANRGTDDTTLPGFGATDTWYGWGYGDTLGLHPISETR